MRDTYFIYLSSFELGQLLDGLAVRIQAWRDTARFLSTGTAPDDLFMPEECTDAEEALRIAAQYAQITATIRRQREMQDSNAMRAEQLPPQTEDGSRPMFCIYVDTLAQGPVPVERDAHGNPAVYPTRHAAERVIAEIAIDRLHEFLAGERGYEEALPGENYVMPVDLMPDGSIWDENGMRFSRGSW